MHSTNVTRLLLASVLASLLVACASAPKIRADADPSANFAAYKTFGFFDRLSIDKPGYSTMAATRLKDATRRELQRRGYQEAQASPQLLVNFNTNIENRTEVQSTGGFYGYRSGMYGSWSSYPSDVYTTHYQQGTLVVDLVDAAKQQLIWQGVAQARLTESMLKQPTQTIDDVVADIFEKYPVPPADAAP
jgi:hypothetical protein